MRQRHPPLPLRVLLEDAMRRRAMTPDSLGRLLGYTNPRKALGRVRALCEGELTSPASTRALKALPELLSIPDHALQEAVRSTQDIVTERQRVSQERKRALRRRVEPPQLPCGVFLTEHRSPTQIVICALLGGPARFRRVRLKANTSVDAHVAQMLRTLESRGYRDSHGELALPFFGRVLGFEISLEDDTTYRFTATGELEGRAPTTGSVGYSEVRW